MKRILIVDGDRRASEAAAAVLEQLDCTVEIVTDAREVVPLLRGSRPDAVLVSLDLPTMEDSRFVAACLAEPGCADVPIVVMGVTPRAAISAIRAGAHGFVKKPVEVAGVVAALPAVLHHAPARPTTGRAPAWRRR
jgi:two-component system response regulator RpfG